MHKLEAFIWILSQLENQGELADKKDRMTKILKKTLIRDNV